uniref:Leucine rich repeat containing 61 n=1 Tax=Paramormyrops kingsleyae TaxID=1676925 RepID=A0A3B3R3U8_9TELE
MDVKREKEQETDVAKITPVLLKSRTGEFDLESILFLKLRNLGIIDLGCIGECMNLERLDLSGNNIANLVPLASLRRLLVLNLSANRIASIESICTCDSLQSLNLAGNLISSVENLHSLKSLRKLENIRLKDNTYDYTNPGERVVGRGSDLYQLCKDIDDIIKAGIYRNGPLPELPDCKPWVEDGFPEIKTSNSAIIEEAYKQFSDILHECRLLNNRAAHVIGQTERALSLKSMPKEYTV